MSYVQKYNQQLRIVLDNPVDLNIKSSIRRVIEANHECSLLAFGKCNECKAYLAMRYGNITIIDDTNVEFDYSQEYKACENVATTVAATIAVSKPTTPSQESVLDISVTEISSGISVSLNLPVTNEGFARTLSPHECAPCTQEHFPPHCSRKHLSEHTCPACPEKHLKDHQCLKCYKDHLADHKCPPCKQAHLSQHKCIPCKLQHMDKHVCQPCEKAHPDQHVCPKTECPRAHLSDHVCPVPDPTRKELQNKLQFCQEVIHRYFYEGQNPSQVVLDEILSTTASATPSVHRRALSPTRRLDTSQSDRSSVDSSPRTELPPRQPAFGIVTKQPTAVQMHVPAPLPVKKSTSKNDGEDLTPLHRHKGRYPVQPQERGVRPPSPARSSVSNTSSHRPTKSNTGLLSSILQTEPRHKQHHTSHHKRSSRDDQDDVTERQRSQR